METFAIILIIIGVGTVSVGTALWHQKKLARKLEIINLANAILQDLCNPNLVEYKYHLYDGKTRIDMDNWETNTTENTVEKSMDMRIDKNYLLSVCVKDLNYRTPKEHVAIVYIHIKNGKILFHKAVTFGNTNK